jgi:polysaccharide export outer membrane protein
MIAVRLREGDLQPGDRIIVTITAGDVRFDTVAVRSNRTVALTGLTEVSLAGVLRSELRPTFESAVGRYLRNARVEARMLMRVSVMGQVVRPGFYSFTSDELLSDVLMVAGGPTAQADMARIEVRRNGTRLFDSQATRQMLASGFTLDDAGMRPGDELLVQGRRTMSQTTVIGWITAIGSLVALAATLAN